METPGTPAIVFSFSALCMLMGALLVLAVRHAAGTVGEDDARVRALVVRTTAGVVAFMVITAAIAASGLLSWGTLPPRMMILVAAVMGLNLWLSLTGFGERLARGLSWTTLSGFQAFRIPVEIFLWQAFLQGFVPERMTFEGLNFDILSGIAGALVAVRATRGTPPRWMLWVFNIGGLLLLINIVTIAILSMPTPLQVFTDGPSNSFVATAPYVWLPVVLVQAALAGHVLSFRKLRMERADG